MQHDEVLAQLRMHRGELDSFGVRSVAVFGSTARGHAGPSSDVDLLVEFDKPVGLFHFLRLRRRLEEILARRVDLVTQAALRDSIRERILAEAIYA